MDELSPEQYEKVLQYMEAVSQEDFPTAVTALKNHDFNLQFAINRKFQSHTRHPAAQAVPNPAADEEIVRRYIDFSRKKNEQWNLLSVLFDIVKYFLLGIFRLLVSLLPNLLAVRYFGTAFQKVYQGRIRQNYTHRSLAYYLPKTKNLSSKSVLLLLSPRAQHPDVLALMNNAELRRKIQQNFFFCCYVADNEQLSKIQGFREAPQAIAVRWNIFQQLVEVGREKNLKSLNADLLGRWAHEGRNLFKRDGNVLVKCRNYLARAQGIYYQQEEEEQVSLTQREKERNEIHQQNQAYRQMEQATKRNRQEQAVRLMKAQQEERMKQQLQEERKIRKMSIPDEPTSGQIIRISFRCPDGTTVFRNFHSNQKLQLIFHWVELNDDIQFQDQKRQFQIMYSYPPEPLSSKKNLLLSEVFESSQEKVLIRQT